MSYMSKCVRGCGAAFLKVCVLFVVVWWFVSFWCIKCTKIGEFQHPALFLPPIAFRLGFLPHPLRFPSGVFERCLD